MTSRLQKQVAFMVFKDDGVKLILKRAHSRWEIDFWLLAGKNPEEIKFSDRENRLTVNKPK